MCAEIKLRAERRAGVLLGEMELKSGRPPTHNSSIVRPLSSSTLNDLDINKTQSSRWQLMAGIPEQVFARDGFSIVLMEDLPGFKTYCYYRTVGLSDEPEWTVNQSP